MANKDRFTDGILGKIKKVKIADITPLTDEENVVVHPESEIKLLEQSIRKFGQYRPIVLDESGKILAGNAVTEALGNLGSKEVYAVQYDDLSEEEKSALLLVDNYTSEMNFFRRGIAEEMAIKIDTTDFDLGDLVITDESITEMFASKSPAVNISTSSDDEPAPEERGNDKMRRLGAYEDDEGKPLSSNEVRCPNCNVVLKV